MKRLLLWFHIFQVSHQRIFSLPSQFISNGRLPFQKDHSHFKLSLFVIQLSSLSFYFWVGEFLMTLGNLVLARKQIVFHPKLPFKHFHLHNTNYEEKWRRFDTYTRQVGRLFKEEDLKYHSLSIIEKPQAFNIKSSLYCVGEGRSASWDRRNNYNCKKDRAYRLLSYHSEQCYYRPCLFKLYLKIQYYHSSFKFRQVFIFISSILIPSTFTHVFTYNNFALNL